MTDNNNTDTAAEVVRIERVVEIGPNGEEWETEKHYTADGLAFVSIA